VRQSKGNIIYVAANYRLGVMGFLAGPSIEKDPTAVANAGFWDQRAALEWIQRHISRFGGDPTDVSLWGESAGAGSILHHLVAFGGKQPGPPLFRKVFAQSPWNVVQYDRKGRLQQQFQDLAKYSNCKDLECLRNAPAATIKRASFTVMSGDLPGHFGFG
jgi:carboxylesterase type B